MMLEKSFRSGSTGAAARGILTRNQAHGSPGNLLDLYALADIPETEMFHPDREPLVAEVRFLGRPRDGQAASSRPRPARG